MTRFTIEEMTQIYKTALLLVEADIVTAIKNSKGNSDGQLIAKLQVINTVAAEIELQLQKAHGDERRTTNT